MMKSVFIFRDLIAALPELILILTGLILLPWVAGKKSDATPRTAWCIFFAFLFAMMIILLDTKDSMTGFAFNGFYFIDHFSQVIRACLLGGAALLILLITPHLSQYKINRPEVPLLILFSVVGMLMMIASNDFMPLFIGIELQTLSLYVIVACQRESLQTNEASLKYFILGALSTAILLFGISWVYGTSGSTNFHVLQDGLRNISSVPLALLFGASMIFVAFAFKMSVAPFHMWTPDVYEGAPTPVTALLSSLPKVAIVCLLLKLVVGPFEFLAPLLQDPLLTLGVISIFVGSLAALQQVQLKRLLAYSSIAHMGFVFLGVALFDGVGTQGALFYITIYFLTSVSFFLCLLTFKNDNETGLERIEDLSGFSKKHPLGAAFLTFLLLSLAGIPPMAGFFSKFFIISSLVNGGYIATAVIAIIGSFIGVFYYLRIIKVMYFEDFIPQDDILAHRHSFVSIPFPNKIVIVVSAGLLIMGSLFPHTLFKYAFSTGAALLLP